MRWPNQLRRSLCIVMLHSSVLVYSSMLVYFILFRLDSLITRLRFARVDGVVLYMLSFVWLWLPNLYHLHISDQFRNILLFQSF